MVDDPDPADIDFLDGRINAFNFATTGLHDGRLLAIIVRDHEGAEMTAGLYGWTWGGACEIRYLWVREDARGRGLGSRMLAAAEDEARRRGCRQVVLSTHSFQAPEFYRRHGYTIVGTVPGYPQGHALHLLVKAL